MDAKIVHGPEVTEDGVAFVVVVDGRDVRVTTRREGIYGAHSSPDPVQLRTARRVVQEYVDRHREEMEKLYAESEQRSGT